MLLPLTACTDGVHRSEDGPGRRELREGARGRVRGAAKAGRVWMKETGGYGWPVGEGRGNEAT